MSVYLDDPQADDWVWKYQESEDEWRFFADDYEPVNSVKVMRWDGSAIPLARRGTTMPREVREVIMRSGLTLFEKSDAGIARVAMDKAVVMKDPMTDQETIVYKDAKVCPTCAGCGQIANDENGTPWIYWEQLPPQSKLAIRIGLVRPLPCPDCKVE